MSNGDKIQVTLLADWLLANSECACHPDLSDLLLGAARCGEGHRQVLDRVARKNGVEYSTQLYLEELVRLWMQQASEKGSQVSLHDLQILASSCPTFIGICKPEQESSSTCTPFSAAAAAVATPPTTQAARFRSIKGRLYRDLESHDEDSLKYVKQLADELLRSVWLGTVGSTLVINIVQYGRRPSIAQFLTTLFELWISLVPDVSEDALFTALTKTSVSEKIKQTYKFCQGGCAPPEKRPEETMSPFFSRTDTVLQLCAFLKVGEMYELADELLSARQKPGSGRYRVMNEISLSLELTNYLYLKTLLDMWRHESPDASRESLLKAITKVLERQFDRPDGAGMEFLAAIEDLPDAVQQSSPPKEEEICHASQTLHMGLTGVIHSNDLRRMCASLVSMPTSDLVLDDEHLLSLLPPCCDSSDKLLLWIVLCVWKCRSKRPSPSGIAKDCEKCIRVLAFDVKAQCEAMLTSTAMFEAFSLSPSPSESDHESLGDPENLKVVFNILSPVGLALEDIDELAKSLLVKWPLEKRCEILTKQLPYWLEPTEELKLWILLLMWQHSKSGTMSGDPLCQALLAVNDYRSLRRKDILHLDWEKLSSASSSQPTVIAKATKDSNSQGTPQQLSDPWKSDIYDYYRPWLVKYLTPVSLRTHFARLLGEMIIRQLMDITNSLVHNEQFLQNLSAHERPGFEALVQYLDSNKFESVAAELKQAL